MTLFFVIHTYVNADGHRTHEVGLRALSHVDVRDNL